MGRGGGRGAEGGPGAEAWRARGFPDVLQLHSITNSTPSTGKVLPWAPGVQRGAGRKTEALHAGASQPSGKWLYVHAGRRCLYRTNDTAQQRQEGRFDATLGRSDKSPRDI